MRALGANVHLLGADFDAAKDGAREFAAATGATMVEDGFDPAIAEGAGSNLFIVKDGTLHTPPLDAGILPGITRELVFEIAAGLGIPTRQDPLHAEDLLGADEAFITSTLKEIMPIARAGDHRIGAGGPGPLTARLHAAYREKTRSHED